MIVCVFSDRVSLNPLVKNQHSSYGQKWRVDPILRQTQTDPNHIKLVMYSILSQVNPSKSSYFSQIHIYIYLYVHIHKSIIYLSIHITMIRMRKPEMGNLRSRGTTKTSHLDGKHVVQGPRMTQDGPMGWEGEDITNKWCSFLQPK